MSNTNYIKIRSLNPFVSKFMFIDTDSYLADNVFINAKLHVSFKDEMARDNDKYRIIFCNVKRSQSETFVKCMEELKKKMILLGNHDYNDVCEEIISPIEKAVSK